MVYSGLYHYGTREHRGALADSLKTSKYISLKRFNKLLPLYEFYTFDERCNQFLFILRDTLDVTHPVWLFIELDYLEC